MKQDVDSSSRISLVAMPSSLHATYFLSFIALLSVCCAFVAFHMRSPQQYFVNKSSGDKAEVFPLTEPNVTAASLVKWVTMAATSAYTLDFYQYQENIDALRNYFTADGYQQYLNSLNASDSLNKIISEKLIVSAVATDTAVILQEGLYRGVYTWVIQLPLLLSYQGASTNSVEKSIAVRLLVTRVPTDDAPKGIGIAQIVDSNYYAEK